MDKKWSVSEAIVKYGLLQNRSRSKALGQHFLTDDAILSKIVDYAKPCNDCDIVEIGPGPCGLTNAICTSIKDTNVFCIEKDVNLKNLHKDFCKNFLNVKFIYDDALNVNISDFIKKNVIVIANLPYNVGTAIIAHLLKNRDKIEKFVVMLQKEVVDRIVALPNTKEYGKLSVLMQILCKCEKLFDLKPGAFLPHPKVISTVVRLTPYKNMISNDEIEKLDIVLSRCFMQRRKMLNKHFTIEVLNNCSIVPTLRPEALMPEQFLELSRNN